MCASLDFVYEGQPVRPSPSDLFCVQVEHYDDDMHVTTGVFSELFGAGEIEYCDHDIDTTALMPLEASV